MRLLTADGTFRQERIYRSSRQWSIILHTILQDITTCLCNSLHTYTYKFI